jgi:hypothetical protein
LLPFFGSTWLASEFPGFDASLFLSYSSVIRAFYSLACLSEARAFSKVAVCALCTANSLRRAAT